jgi:hypothetical protein
VPYHLPPAGDSNLVSDVAREFCGSGTRRRWIPDLYDLAWLWRRKAQFRSGKGIDPLGVAQRGELNLKAVILLHLFSLLLLHLLNQIAITNALEVLPGKEHDEKESQGPQGKQPETFPAFLVINFTLQARIVDTL